MKISAILDKIDEKQLFVPAFQREYVWKRDDAKQLIDSLIKEYPTGTMLLWETANPPALKGPHKYHKDQGAVRLLLDGQQRVTTLYMLIRGVIPPYYTIQEIVNDTRGLYVNLQTLELSYYMKTKMENNPYWQNITDVFQKKVDAFILQEQFKSLSAEISYPELQQLNANINAITRVLDREFPEQTIPVKATIREAIDIFYKVNASGVALTDAELALAQISGYWPEARDRFKAKLYELEKHGFVFHLDFVVYVLLGCLYHLGSDMKKLHGSENKEVLQSAWDILENQIIDYVVNIMRTHAYVDHSDEINSVYALVPIIVYCFDKKGKPLSDQEIKKMVKWFYYSQIRSRYVSQLPQKLDRDLRCLAESKQPFDDLLQVIADENRLEIMPFEFVGRAIQHPLFSMTRWYLKSKNAVCLTTGISLHHPMGKKYQLELDHIFPYSLLKKAGYGWENRVKYALAQEFTNRAILTKLANRTKSDSSAADYLRAVKQNFPNSLALQSIPEDEALWQIENYEFFLEKRREMLAAELNAFLENITSTELTQVPASTEDLIAEGESEGLEFKSTLRWDLKQGEINKALEDVIMKTVAAFANSQGGILFIGVDDDGKVLGLKHDYHSLGNVDKDKFELHLRNLLNQHFEKGFVATKIKISFPLVEDEEICQIEVATSPEPIVLKFKDRNGALVEKFYVRSGNSSQEIPMSEFNKYIKTHFQG
ncbi:MAG TPA: DUF262 domain-containing protein [bacterium]|nr:DUF262 domain-containing protein [bacterium]HQI47432.1 DUF262 domain-containing protein [bacterium]HQJ64677.1 DUF262 domain-containing protein [bacterium]